MALLCTDLGACEYPTARLVGSLKGRCEASLFCLPESEQASRQARQEPDGVMVGARDDDLSGSDTKG